MLKRLELGGLRADRSAVQDLLATRSELDDPIGWLQYSARLEELDEEIAKFEDAPDPFAGVALYFGGGPVNGTHGILADFAGKAIGSYQDLIAKRHAAINATLPKAPHGKRTGSKNTELLVTEIVRGSFGFVLEEANDHDPLFGTALKQVVEEVSDILCTLGKDSDECSNAIVQTAGARVVKSLQDFFAILDDAKATIRIVDNHKDFALQREDVERAKQRVDTAKIKTEDEQVWIGRLWLLPYKRRFEFSPTQLERMPIPLPIDGTVSTPCIQDICGSSEYPPADFFSREWKAHIRIVETLSQGKHSRSYTLTKISPV